MFSDVGSSRGGVLSRGMSETPYVMYIFTDVGPSLGGSADSWSVRDNVQAC